MDLRLFGASANDGKACILGRKLTVRLRTFLNPGFAPAELRHRHGSIPARRFALAYLEYRRALAPCHPTFYFFAQPVW